MAPLLEARATITAKDDTAAAFASVGAKIDALHGQISNLNSAISSVAPSASLVQRAQGAITARSQWSAPGVREEGPLERRNLLTKFPLGTAKAAEEGVLSQALGWAAALTGLSTVFGGMKQSMVRAHERARMEGAAMTAQEVTESTTLAGDLSKKYPAIPEADLMNMLRNARSIVGSFDEAAKLMNPLSQLYIVAKEAKLNASPEEMKAEFDTLLKGIEIKGATQSPEEFNKYMEGIARGLEVFGDTLPASAYRDAIFYGRQASKMLSDEFVLGVGPTLAQEMGGKPYGRSLSDFNAEVIGGVMKHAALLDMQSLGLVNDADLAYTKTGAIKGLLPGRHLAGWEIAQTNPYEWLRGVYLPALAKHGVTSDADISAHISADFQNRMVGQIASLILTQDPRMQKDFALLRMAKGLATAKDFAERDPEMAAAGFSNTLKGIVADLTPTNENLAKMLADSSAWLNSWRYDQKRDGTWQNPRGPEVRLFDPSAPLQSLYPGVPITSADVAPRWMDWLNVHDKDAARSSLWRSGYRPGDLQAETARESSRAGWARGQPSHEAMSVTVSGQAHGEIRVIAEAGSTLIRLVDQVSRLALDFPLTGRNTGRMDSDAAPARGIGHQ